MIWRPDPALTRWFRDALGPREGSPGKRATVPWAVVDHVFQNATPAGLIPHLASEDPRVTGLLHRIGEIAPPGSFGCTESCGHPLFTREAIHPPSNYNSCVFDMRVATEYLREGDVFVDCGACVGVYTLNAAAAVGPTGRVLAVEPDTANLDLLAANVTLNGFDNVVVFSGAVADRIGLGTLYRDSNRGGFSHQLWPAPEFPGAAEVPVTTVDELCAAVPRVAAIKMDTQGYEVKALEGARQTIRRSGRMALMLEVWPRGLDGCGDSAERFADLLWDDLGFTVLYLVRAESPVCLMRLGGKANILGMAEHVRDNPAGDYFDLWCLKG